MTCSAGSQSEARESALVVTDQTGNFRALAKILADLPLNLVRAASPEKALRQFTTGDFALIVLDLQTKGLDGLKIARKIRKRESGRITPILLLAAVGDVAFPVAEAYALGGVDYLARPLVPAVFRAKVEGAIELSQRTERLRDQGEERFRLLADSAPMLLWLADAEGRCTYFNKSWLDFTGRTAEQEAGDGWAEGVHPDDRARCLATYQAALRSREPFRMEYRLRRADGAFRWVQDMGTPCVNPDGGFAGFIGSAIDIMERRAAEEERAALLVREQAARTEAEQQRDFARLLVENAPVAVAVSLGPEHRVVQMNPAAQALTGLSREAVIGKAASEGSQEARLAVAALCDQVYRTGRPQVVPEMRLALASGRVLFFQMTFTPLPGPDGKPIGVIQVGVDITARKRAELALKEADRHKDEFLAMLSHELRNPLAPILTGLELLQQGDANDRVRDQALGLMGRQVRHLARLLDDLLDVSRITRGTVPLRLECLDLSQLARATAEDRRPLLERAGLALAVTEPAAPIWVEGDSTRLAQVLDNLLDNAAKFTPRGGKVTVAVSVDDAAAQAVLMVRDTGAGIEPRTLPHLFDVFMQADQGLDRTPGGLGLGLALVKGLTELHNGEVEAASAGPGQGATFTVRLPLAKVSGVPPVHPSWSKMAEKGSRVLVVEDNHDTADSLALYLELHGHEVAVAYNGPQAVEKATTWRPDVVLCDLGLPLMDGYGVAAALRRDPATAAIRLIALTGYGSEEDRRRTRLAGFDHHLTKPVEPEELARLLAART
jgi:PAS domain S-box-containing protein